MRIASNKIRDVIRYFQEELQGLYEKTEIMRFASFCFESYTGLKPHELTTAKERTISESELLRFSFAVKALKQHRPIQYILGEADFYGSKLFVNEHVLIPRPETEELVDLIIKENRHRSGLRILDIGTGSGCIAIALKKALPGWELTAVDVSPEALKVAERNAAGNNAEITFLRADLFASEELPGSGRYDIIVSNPPYVAVSEKGQMEKNVLDHEPHLALFVPDQDPFVFYREICARARRCLSPDGLVYFEINAALGPETKIIMEDQGLKNVRLIKDMNNKNRILRGSMK